MRIAHLHIPGLIPYSHSLALQNAILQRHFRYKDWIRAFAGANHDSAGARDQGNTDNGDDVSGQEGSLDHKSVSRSKAGDILAVESGKSSFDTGMGNCSTSSKPKWYWHLKPSIQYRHETSPPDPVLLTFSTPPTYTAGRRHLITNPVSAEQQSFLSANGLASFHASPRGGLLTYHAPGQVTGYVIADLRRHGITARCWVRLLEDSVIRTCGAWGVRTGRTNDPGVWILDPATESQSRDTQAGSLTAPSREDPRPTDRKICAIGVQVSRGITSHGVGLNVHDASLAPLLSMGQTGQEDDFAFSAAQLLSPSYDASSRGYLSWGFSRIVACGLEGKSVSWLTREIPDTRSIMSDSNPPPPSPNENSQPTEELVAKILAREVMHGMNVMRAADKDPVEGIYQIEEADVLG